MIFSKRLHVEYSLDRENFLLWILSDSCPVTLNSPLILFFHCLWECIENQSQLGADMIQTGHLLYLSIFGNVSSFLAQCLPYGALVTKADFWAWMWHPVLFMWQEGSVSVFDKPKPYACCRCSSPFVVRVSSFTHSYSFCLWNLLYQQRKDIL